MIAHTCSIGLFKKHQLWKLKAGRVVSHGFRHAEFDGARKNRFQALLGVANLISNFWKCMGGQKIEMRKSYQIGAYYMQNEERIPNLASEFKSDKI